MQRDKRTINLAQKRAQNKVIRLRKRLNKSLLFKNKYFVYESTARETSSYFEEMKLVRFNKVASWSALPKPFVGVRIEEQKVINNQIKNIMTTKEKIAVMQAWEDGKIIQVANQNQSDWTDMDNNIVNPMWNWQIMKYRIKPEPKLRPYKNAKEFLHAQKEHGMYVIFSNLSEYILAIPNCIDNESVIVEDEEYTYKQCLDSLKWQDDSPCGIMEE